MMRFRTLLLGFFVILLLACGETPITPATPPEIRYGEDVCDQCGMIISDERFAAGLVLETASNVFEHRIFDDIGDLLLFEHEHANEFNIVAYYVHDYTSKTWIDGQQAYYIHSQALSTPMGFGLAAAAQKLEAESLAKEWNGTVLSFTELREQLAAITGVEEHAQHSGQ